MSARTFICGGTAVAALLVAFNVAAQPHKPVGDPPQRLTTTIYQSDTDAAETLGALKALEDAGALKLDSYAMVGRDAAGKVSVLDKRQPKTRAGSAVGSVVELLGGPFTVGIPNAVGGGPTAYLAGAGIGMSKDTLKKLKTSLQPGQTALITVVDEQVGPPAAKLQETIAAGIFSHPIPGTTAQPGFNDATRGPAPDRLPKSERPKSVVVPPPAPASPR